MFQGALIFFLVRIFSIPNIPIKNMYDYTLFCVNVNLEGVDA